MELRNPIVNLFSRQHGSAAASLSYREGKNNEKLPFESRQFGLSYSYSHGCEPAHYDRHGWTGAD